MKQHSKLFVRHHFSDDSVDIKLNKFLDEHSNYVIDKISLVHSDGTCVEKLFVVFTIEEDE